MPSTSKADADKRCVHPSMRSGSISLPVVKSEAKSAGASIRPSRAGRRRAIVLALVQGLLIAHIVLWLLSRKYGWFDGRTISPVEPSESMEFSRHGIVNAGLIFFVVALLSTLIFGRWFCGWGCHIVLLQDLCGWIMKKMGVRPKPFRSRLLIYVPLILAVYMFLWPAAFRIAVAPAMTWASTKWAVIPDPGPVAHWGFQSQLTTTEFWKTFPGVFVAIPFLLVCGFATVYFLGAKGFCTYGCPYGGFFAPLDKIAVGKIRVTDACHQCGHCTAVCTSNVRVHEEVREYGMVVDPGCMKCLDCVSVCPNEALYFGFGAPAIFKGEAKHETPTRKYDMTWGEEIAFAGVFAATFFSTRGVYGLIPMLMAAGLAGCVTFVVWKCWRMLRDPNVTLHRFQLKLKGRWKRAGVIFASLTAVASVLVVHSGMINAFKSLGDRQFSKVVVNPAEVSAGRLASVDDADREHARKALAWYDCVVSVPSGGYAITSIAQDEIDGLRSRMRSVLNEFDEAEKILRESFARRENESTAMALARFLSDRDDSAKQQEALDIYERVLPQHPEYTQILGDYEPWALSIGRVEQVMSVHRARLLADPRNLPSLRSLSVLLMQTGHLPEGLDLNARWIERDPSSSEAHRWRALGLADAGQMDQAITTMRRAADLAPNDPDPRSLLADMLQSIGRTMEADVERARAQELATQTQSSRPTPHP